jgi:hypothetical protein
MAEPPVRRRRPVRLSYFIYASDFFARCLANPPHFQALNKGGKSRLFHWPTAARMQSYLDKLTRLSRIPVRRKVTYVLQIDVFAPFLFFSMLSENRAVTNLRKFGFLTATQMGYTHQ